MNLSFTAQTKTEEPVVRCETKEETVADIATNVEGGGKYCGVVFSPLECWRAGTMNAHAVFTIFTGESRAETEKTKCARGARRSKRLRVVEMKRCRENEPHGSCLPLGRWCHSAFGLNGTWLTILSRNPKVREDYHQR